MDVDKPVRLQVCGMAGTICELAVPLSIPLAHMQDLIHAKSGILQVAQRLLAGCREWRAGQCLGELGLEPEGGDYLLTLVRRTPLQIALLSNPNSRWMVLPDEARCDGDLILSLCLKHCTDVYLYRADHALLSDRSFALAAMRELSQIGCRCTLQPFDDAIKADREIVLEAVRSRPSNLTLASEELRCDKEVVVTALRAAKQIGGPHAVDVSVELRADREVALLIVDVSPCGLSNLSSALRDDVEVVQAAVRKMPHTLQFASERFRDDEETAWIAVSSKSRQRMPLDILSLRLCSKIDFMLKAVQVNGLNLELACDALRGNRRVVLAAIASSGMALRFASEKLRDDKKVVLAAVSKTYRALEYASVRLRGDKDLAIAAVKRRPSGRLPRAVRSLRKDPAVLRVVQATRSVAETRRRQLQGLQGSIPPASVQEAQSKGREHSRRAAAVAAKRPAASAALKRPAAAVEDNSFGSRRLALAQQNRRSKASAAMRCAPPDAPSTPTKKHAAQTTVAVAAGSGARRAGGEAKRKR